jgi:hypothetical protein
LGQILTSTSVAISFFLPSSRNPGTPIALPSLKERAMHIHASNMNMNSASLYSAAAAEKAAAAQRAADVRKKLMKSASDIEGVSSPDEAYMIGQWMDSRHSQVLGEDEYHTVASGKDPDFG